MVRKTTKADLERKLDNISGLKKVEGDDGLLRYEITVDLAQEGSIGELITNIKAKSGCCR